MYCVLHGSTLIFCHSSPPLVGTVAYLLSQAEMRPFTALNKSEINVKQGKESDKKFYGIKDNVQSRKSGEGDFP